MSDKIVILGGYGAVGKVTAAHLAEHLPGQVVIAGRDLRRAERLARLSEGALLPAQVDVGDTAAVQGLLREAKTVIMCIERANVEVARACLERGIHYVDISASAPVLDSIARLRPVAERNAATAVLSVGVAPGLTNLLARHSAESLPSDVRKVDLSLLLGMGGDHGPDSVRWVVDHLMEPGGRSGRARVHLPGFGTRTVHPFPFSDQYTISESLGVEATTRICFDTSLLTSTVFALRATGFFSLMRRLDAGPALTSLMGRLHFGSDAFVVQATAEDAAGNTASTAITGRDTCQATGVVTAHVARMLHSGTYKPGVLHIDQFLDHAPLFSELERHGMQIRRAQQREEV